MMVINLVGSKSINQTVAEKLELNVNTKLGKLLSDLGFTQEFATVMLAYLSPIWEQYVAQQMNDVITLDDAGQIEQISDEYNFDDAQRDLMYIKFYEQKSGKTLDQDVQFVLDRLADMITQTLTGLNQITLEVANLDGEELEARFDALLEEKINQLILV